MRISATSSQRTLLVAALVAVAWLALPDSSYGQSRRSTRRSAPTPAMPQATPAQDSAPNKPAAAPQEYLLPAVQPAAPTPAAASSRRQRKSNPPAPAPYLETEFQVLVASTPCPHLTIPAPAPAVDPAPVAATVPTGGQGDSELQLAAPLPQIVTADVAVESLAAEGDSPCPPTVNDVAIASPGEIELFRDPQEFKIDTNFADMGAEIAAADSAEVGPPILSGESLADAIDAEFTQEFAVAESVANAVPPTNAGPPILSSAALAESLDNNSLASAPATAGAVEPVAAQPQDNSEMPLFVDLSRFRVQRPIPTEPVDMTLADGATQRAAEFTWQQDPIQDQGGLSVRPVPDAAAQQVQESDREQELLARMREPLPASPLSRVGIPVEAENKLVEPERFTDRHYGDYQQSATIEVGPRQLSYVQWQPRAYAWAAPNFYHRPLYYEEPNLERYGFDHGCAQPVCSAGHFFVSTVLLPLQIGGDHPCSRAYSLGYYRPGSCNPAYLSHYPVTPRGLIYQSLSTVGIVFILP